LRTDCGFFLAAQRDREMARKRGGGRSFVAIDAGDAESRYRVEPVDASALTPDLAFDRAWALTVLERSMAEIEREYAASGRGHLFGHLRGVLAGEAAYAGIADRAGMSASAVESAARRLRKRFAAIVRGQIAETLDDPEQVEDEVRALFVALSR
jgi:RNA polymerase sigma-70 factor (ECF subfamily)